MRKSFLVFGDIIALYAALIIALFVRYGGATNSYILSIHLAPFSVIFAFWILVFYIANLYDFSISKNTYEYFSTFFSTLLFNTLAAIAFFYFLPFFRITPRTNFFIFLGFGFAILGYWRYYFNQLLARRGLKNNTLIIGINQQSPDLQTQAEELFSFMKSNPQLGYNALDIAVVDPAYDLATLESTIRDNNIKTLILSPAVYKLPRIINVLYRLLRYNIKVFNLSAFFEKTTGKIPLGAIDQIWFLENLSGNEQRFYEVVKRGMDVIGSIILGLITLPLYPFIILAIKLESPGPIFYRQARVGKSGKLFTVIKFRTMVQTAEHTGPQWAIENDNRTTRIGKFLRRTRIDELPQLWNVLRGEMSFIGPRPERPEFHDSLKSQIPFYEERYLVTPGLTGWAQVKYKLDFRGAMTIADTAEKVKHDLYYIKNRSIFLDLGILLKTIKIILKKVVK